MSRTPRIAKALPSNTLANAAFPNVVPGIAFAGYDAPFTWNNVSPRAGLVFDPLLVCTGIEQHHFGHRTRLGRPGGRRPVWR